MCTNYYDHCMCIWVVMVADGQTSIILVIFWPFYPLPPWKIEKWNLQKIFKKSGVIAKYSTFSRFTDAIINMTTILAQKYFQVNLLIIN